MASRSVDELVRKFDRAAKAMPRAQQDAARRAGPAIKASWVGIAAGAGLRPGARVARRKWGVRYSVGRKGNLYVRFTGPVHLVNGDTKAHPIVPKALRKAQGQALIGALTGVKVSRRLGGRGRRALTIGSDVRSYANHPGTKGKRFWPACNRISRQLGPRIYMAQTGTSLLKRSGFGP
jgi:hypothetical protein